VKGVRSHYGLASHAVGGSVDGTDITSCSRAVA
jgi:hypothetical protein